MLALLGSWWFSQGWAGRASCPFSPRQPVSETSQQGSPLCRAEHRPPRRRAGGLQASRPLASLCSCLPGCSITLSTGTASRLGPSRPFQSSPSTWPFRWRSTTGGQGGQQDLQTTVRLAQPEAAGAAPELSQALVTWSNAHRADQGRRTQGRPAGTSWTGPAGVSEPDQARELPQLMAKVPRPGSTCVNRRG